MQIYIDDYYLDQINIDTEENLSQIIFSSGSAESAHYLDDFLLDYLTDGLDYLTEGSLIEDELNLY